jgi:hypothetical protein
VNRRKKTILQSDFVWTHHKFVKNVVQISNFIKENQPKMAKNGGLAVLAKTFYRIIESIKFLLHISGLGPISGG